MSMMDELILSVARTTPLPPEQAALAVEAVLRFFTARLPSALVGQLHARLGPPSAKKAQSAANSSQTGASNSS